MIVFPEESILEYFCVNFLDPFRMTNMEESWAFSNAKFLFMMVTILRKQSYADFICDEACVLASVLLGFFFL
ncbi:hypothetical protein [Chryseobacterium gambrini]|uniref:hypothetical protein n=1 Tax=Chryseobacterium gambrini TaxID=373672 RepID=UPI0022F1A50F|nr:hypothetical protein [Chryseobacterium gambrini]WBV53766.1 hypothetical protein PFY09_05450 [Chryseobacterium gambrini]